jgi:hypothetical protein
LPIKFPRGACSPITPFPFRILSHRVALPDASAAGHTFYDPNTARPFTLEQLYALRTIRPRAPSCIGPDSERPFLSLLEVARRGGYIGLGDDIL